MPVTIMKTTGVKFLKSGGVSPEDCNKVTLANMTVITTQKAVKLLKDGEVLASCALSPKEFEGIHDDGAFNTLSSGVPHKLHKMVHDALGALNTIPGDVMAAHAIMPTGWKGAKHEAPPKITMAALKDATMSAPAAVAHAVFGEVPGDIAHMPRIKLINATHLYQPVMGTGNSSRYFLVAACEDLKVACRYRNDTLSIRVEGDMLKYNNHLTAAGFTSVGDSYASMHLGVPDDVLASKTLGSIIMGIKVPMRTAYPDLDKIKGEGS